MPSSFPSISLKIPRSNYAKARKTLLPANGGTLDPLQERVNLRQRTDPVVAVDNDRTWRRNGNFFFPSNNRGKVREAVSREYLRIEDSVRLRAVGQINAIPREHVLATKPLGKETS